MCKVYLLLLTVNLEEKEKERERQRDGMVYLHSFNKQAQVLRASTASADGTIIRMQTNITATSIERK